MNEPSVGSISWQHPRRGKQKFEVLLSCAAGTTVILRHDDEQAGARRSYVPLDELDALIALLQRVRPAIAEQQKLQTPLELV